ncbi:MAG: recombination protein RecR [Gammaproteobacteria bacterium]|nr:recombination protein RecR [Gammaproteobacteria bacterium]|tara:strand:- start:714 stop:1334 length:621 start_codon:yes stop_codon:yes gene_type:complete
MNYSPLIEQLIQAFQRLPGVGPKSAQRMVLHFLEKDRDGGRQLAKALEEAVEGVGQCQRCRTLSEEDICQICADPRRDSSLLCVVETPADVFAVEQSSTYKGYYFVLMGHLSPIDGIGPEEIGVNDLVQRVKESAAAELILATNPTVEGEATAYYIAEQMKIPELQERQLKVSRIAHGIPLGGELEYIDGGTLIHSFAGRQSISGN